MLRSISGGISHHFLTVALSCAFALAFGCGASDKPNQDEGLPVQSVQTPAPSSTPTVGQPAISEHLSGRIGASTQWDSGWIDLTAMTSFKRGDKLKLRVGGSAHTILVRFLGKGDDPNDPVGIEGGAIDVPDDRLVQLILQADHEDVAQISVHGGPNPWNLYPLGGDNGPATILSVERVAP